MKIKTSELTEAALNWAVGVCQHVEYIKGVAQWFNDVGETISYTPSTDWSQGGPIIENEYIGVLVYGAASSSPKNPDYWAASMHARNERLIAEGPTPLIAAMRCYVASKLGDEFEIPIQARII